MAASTFQDKQYDRYIAEITRHPLLTAEEELDLAFQARDGDEAAVEKLVNSNLRFVVKVALQYRGYGIRSLDLIQEGNLGLMKAVEKFDPERGYRLVTYAVHWIRAFIRAYILGQWSLVRVGTTHAERRLFYRLPKARREIGAAADGNPQEVIEALAAHLGATEEQVSQAQQRIYKRDVSTMAPLPGVEGDDLTLQDTLVDDEMDPASQVLEAAEMGALRQAISRAMEGLDDRQQYIIQSRFLGDEKVTLAKLGTELGLSRERVRQLEVAAKKQLAGVLSAEAPDLVEDVLGS